MSKSGSKYKNNNEYTCECGKVFEKPQSLNAHFTHCLIHRKGVPGNITRQLIWSNYPKNKQSIAKKKYEEFPKHCLQCSDSLSYKCRHNIFCNRKCSAIYTNSFRQGKPLSIATRKKISEKLIGRKVGGRPTMPRIGVKCLYCFTSFVVKWGHRYRKYCSTSCANKDPARAKSGGGMRKGSGRGKSGKYRGIYCGSTWELAYLVYCLDKGIAVKRCDKNFKYSVIGVSHTYFPDFRIDNLIIEIKGFVLDKETHEAKLKSVKTAGFKVLVLGKPEMKPYLDYAVNKLGKKLELAYDTVCKLDKAA